MNGSSTAGSATSFRKRTYSLSSMAREARVLTRRGRTARTAWRPDRVEPLLREQMMFAVSMVNGCTFCAYVHNSSALSEGAERAQLAELVGLDPTTTTDDRLIAVAWAQSRASANLGPAAEWLDDELRARYSPQQVQDFDTIVRFMTLNNIAGNTAEALIRRLRGNPVESSGVAAEIVIGGGYLLGSLPTAVITALRQRHSPAAAIREFRALDGAQR
ncbi:carboxymuconolactone decarboxylase family protein [Nocardia sp. CA-128927]|uniref:carboxymuconolactone decarboxylase family protein n=1 Tax=Nocardia sp. CA-128927 TaxID=3239975 RepID=UPI003D96EF09